MNPDAETYDKKVLTYSSVGKVLGLTYSDFGSYSIKTDVYDINTQDIIGSNIEKRALIKSQLKPIKHEDSSFIYNRFLEILRHNVVSDKGNAFNKIFTLFLCKVYDETSKQADEELDFQFSYR